MFLRSKIGKLNRTLNKIAKINKFSLKNEDNEKKEKEIHKLHIFVSSALFQAAKIHDTYVIDLILKNDFVRSDLTVDENGLNIVQYSLLQNDSELFKILFLKYYKYIQCYFSNPKDLFLIILNKRNFELIEFFITTPVLLNELRKENISLCLYLLIKSGKDELLNLLLLNKDIQELFDGRDIQSLLIYFISNNDLDKVQKICNYKVIISKCDKICFQNLVALTIMNNSIKALEILIENTDILNLIISDDMILKNVVLFAYNNNSLSVLSKISKNKIISSPKTKEDKVKKSIPKSVIKLRKAPKIVEDSI